MTFVFFRIVSQRLLTRGQYGMCYRQAYPNEIARNEGRVGELSPRQYICVGDDVRRPLVQAHWADGRLMVLRNKPVLIYADSFAEKEKEDRGAYDHSRLYGELILYRPWLGRDETAEFGNLIRDRDACRARYAREKVAIENVKEGLKNMLLERM